MAGYGSLAILTLLLNILFVNVYSNPVSISPQSVPDYLIQSSINSLNANSPTQNTYRGGYLISAQKLLNPNFVIYRLALNLETICANDLSSCPREACAIDLKDRAGEVEIDRNSIQCMYLYPQSAQEDVQPVQQQTESVSQENFTDSDEGNRKAPQNILELDHEVQAAVDSQRSDMESLDKPFIAVRAVNSNYCPGCPYELNPDLPGLVAFGAQALDMMDRLGHNDFKYKLNNIVKVTRAVPPGLNVVQYQLLATIGESNCLKTTLVDRSECLLQVNVPLRWCLITFEQRPWQQSDRQVVGNNCTESSYLENEINAGLAVNGAKDQSERTDSAQEIIEKTTHTDQLAQEGMIATYGSVVDKNLESPASDTMPNPTVTEASSIEGMLFIENGQRNRGEQFLRDPYESVKRDGVQGTNEDRSMVTETQFTKVELERKDDKPQVQGFINKQKEFDEFLADFDIPLRTDTLMVDDNREGKQPVTEEIIRPQRVESQRITETSLSASSEDNSSESSESSSNESGEYVVNPQRKKRAVANSHDSEKYLVQELARKAVNTLDNIDQDDNKRVVVSILDSKKEVLNGYLYHLILEVVPTDCKEESKGETDRDCLDKISGPTKVCKVQIHTDEKNPLISAKVVKSECSKKMIRGKNLRNKRTSERLGGEKPISIDDEVVQNFTTKGLQKFSETFEGTNEPVLVDIISATKQIVAGTLYKIQVRLGVSDCPKGTKTNCLLKADSEVKECEIKAWLRPWIAEQPHIEVNCGSNDRSKRSLRGNIREKRAIGLVGAPSSISVNDEKISNYAHMGLQKFSKNFEGPNELILVEIVSVTRQVVQGNLYKIKVKIGTSNCPKGTKENCQLKADSEIKECEIKAWSREWLPEDSLDIQVNCNSNNRARRSLKGKNYSQKMLDQSLSLNNERLFNDFIVKYNKSYSTISEKKNRFKIFQQNMMMVQELQRNEQGTAIYGATMFADLTTEEFQKSYLGLKPELRVDNDIPMPMAEIPNITIPDSYDWRNYNVVTAVKNQGSCGSCWAFSVTGNVEGQYALRHGSLLSFSEQELVDCDTLDEGCNGGLPDNAYRAIEKLGGLELESDYPYDAEDETCHFKKNKAKVNVVSAVNITSNETQMAQWLVQNGPISIGINANAMQFYVGGISHPLKFLCSPSNLDHGVLIVGYGTHTYPIFHKTLPYWTIKNSWGPMWGEKGYYRVYRGDGTCGVNQMASSAIVA